MKLSRKSIFSSGVLVIAFLGFFLSAYKYSDLKGLRRLVVAFKIAIFLMVSPLSPANAKDSGFLPGAGGFTPPLSRLAPHNQSKFTAGSKAKGAARTDFARRQTGKKPTSGRSGGSLFAEAFTVEPKFAARPGGNGDGLFGRFTPRPTPDPGNPGCAGGPRSITVLSGQRNSDESTKLTAYDGFEAKLTDKSENHLTSKHGHKFGVDDPLISIFCNHFFLVQLIIY